MQDGLHLNDFISSDLFRCWVVEGVLLVGIFFKCYYVVYVVCDFRFLETLKWRNGSPAQKKSWQRAQGFFKPHIMHTFAHALMT